MTAAIFSLSPKQIIIAMDTLAMAGGTGTPCFFATKFYPLPHLQGVMFATGVGDLATQWFVTIGRFLVRDIHHLDQIVTPSLQKLGREFNLSEALTTTLYHVGYSEAESRYVGFAYRSNAAFRSERLGYGLYTKPPIPNASVESFPDDLIRLMEAQRANDSALPISERVFIGGEIETIVLENKTMTVQTVHRFEDYEEVYQRMCDELPANKT